MTKNKIASSKSSPSKKSSYRGMHIIWYILGVIPLLLVLRFAQKLFGANSSELKTKTEEGIEKLDNHIKKLEKKLKNKK